MTGIVRRIADIIVPRLPNLNVTEQRELHKAFLMLEATVRDVSSIRSGGSVGAFGGSVTEGPGIDLIVTQVGLGGDTVLVYDSGSDPVAESPATEAGLVAALAAVVSGDIIECPRQISIALTSGITIPDGVTLREFNLAFSGFAGNAITLSDNSTVRAGEVVHDGTGEATAVAIFAASGTSLAKIVDVVAEAKNATTNTGIDVTGNAIYNGVGVIRSVGRATGGTNNRGILIGDYTFAQWSRGTAKEGSGYNYGIVFNGSASDVGAPLASHCIGRSRVTAAWGGRVLANKTGRAVECNFDGQTGGVTIETGATLEAGDNYWNTVTITGTLTYLRGDRGAYSEEDFHATDIEAAALTRHLPLPGTDGNTVRDNGTNWVSVASGAYVWEPLTNGDGDNPGLIYDENGDVIMVEVVY